MKRVDIFINFEWYRGRVISSQAIVLAWDFFYFTERKNIYKTKSLFSRMDVDVWNS